MPSKTKKNLMLIMLLAECTILLSWTREAVRPLACTREAVRPRAFTREAVRPLACTREAVRPLACTREAVLPLTFTREAVCPLACTKGTYLLPGALWLPCGICHLALCDFYCVFCVYVRCLHFILADILRQKWILTDCVRSDCYC